MTRSGLSRAFSGAACAAVAAFALAGPSAGAGHRRLALIIGNDNGGGDTRPLMYAAEDARRMHEVLTQLGGVARDDAVLLTNRTAHDLVRSLGDLEKRAAEARAKGERTTLILYYSGHAKDGALRLGHTQILLDDLKGRLSRGPADVLVGVFDSCRSGAITRTKGVRKGPAFDVQSASGDEARGVVFLSSSSADEDAQEADEIRGSYFSHHLASGLRGSADRSGDGRITLSEAYAYAYARTVADTAESSAGAQHPTFSYDLKGNGDLVLTEFAGRQGGLVVPAAAPEGTYFIVRGGFIAAEMDKPTGQERRIALAPGGYVIKRRLPDKLRVGKFDVPEGRTVTLDEGLLRDVPFTDDPVKGARRGPVWSLSVAGTVQSFFDEPTRETLFPPAGMLGAELLVRDFFRRSWTVGVDLAAGGARATLPRPSGSALPFKFGELSLGGSLFTEWNYGSRGQFAPFLGGRLAVLFMTREFEQASIPKQVFSTVSPGLVGGIRWQFADSFSALARARLHYLLYNIGEDRSLGYWELATAVSYEF